MKIAVLAVPQEVERYKMFDPAEVAERAHEAASRAVSLSSKRLEETMAKAAKAKQQAEEQVRFSKAEPLHLKGQPCTTLLTEECSESYVVTK